MPGGVDGSVSVRDSFFAFPLGACRRALRACYYGLSEKGGPLASAFNKELVRSIRKSAGRFAAIAIISLLGAGFYAGLRMAAPDMRLAGDEFFDGCSLYDISVVSSLGLDDESVRILDGIDGVGQVMPAYKADAMVLLPDGSHAACVESLPIGSARESDSSDGLRVLSDDEGYLNRPILVSGSWPATAGECVVSADAAEELGIGIGDSIEVEKVAETDVEDTFSRTLFRVSGLVNSPAYASTGFLGTTKLGTGTFDLYLYVDPSAFDEDLPYSTAYLTVPAATHLTWQSKGYKDAVGEVKVRVDDASPEIAAERWDNVRGEAQEELDDARADYEREKADAEAELADAQAELEDARKKLDDAASELAQAGAQLDSGAREIADNEAKLREGEESYAQGKAELDARLPEFEREYARIGELRAQREQLAAGVEQAQAGVAMLEQQLAQAQAAGAPAGQIAIIEAQLAQARAQADVLAQQLAQLDAGIAQLEAAKAEIDAAQAQLAAARAELDSGWAQLEQGRAEYYQGLAQYQSGLAEYQDGEREYADGLAKYEDGRAEADEKLADAEAKLADAQRDIDDIERPEVFVMDRAKNAGAAQLASDADGIQQIALFLPFMFFLVAALVSLTSMTRMVDEERLEIGTHKALGYGRMRITSKYLIYGVLASGIGSIVGIIAFGKFLPWIIMTSYQVTYAVPNVPLPIDAGIAARAIGLSVGVTAIATWAAAAASLRERPASLMLPRAPKAGKRIILERITPLWSRLSFSHKVTARNLLRYKRRFFMAVVGIAGCTALLVIGFGLRDAIDGVVSNQYGSIVNYDAVVRIDDDATDEARERVKEALGSPDVSEHIEVADFNMVAHGPDEDMRVEVVVPSDDRMGEFVALRDRVSGDGLALAGDSVVITEKAAEVMGLRVGDTVDLYDENRVGDATGEARTFTVSGIAENYLGHFAYLLPGGYRQSFGEEPSFNAAYVKFADGADTKALSDELLAIEGVNTVSFVSDEVRTYEDMLALMAGIIAIVIALSAALAFVVLYNLTNINITERVREIATLKVLGFTKREVNAYIFREVIVMSLVGAIVGCIIGGPLTSYISQAAETPQMMFGRTIWPLSYVLSFVITMAFSAVVAFTMRWKLNRVNMVESLKSVE